MPGDKIPKWRWRQSDGWPDMVLALRVTGEQRLAGRLRTMLEVQFRGTFTENDRAFLEQVGIVAGCHDVFLNCAISRIRDEDSRRLRVRFAIGLPMNTAAAGTIDKRYGLHGDEFHPLLDLAIALSRAIRQALKLEGGPGGSPQAT